MAISNSEKNAAKAKASTYLEKSVYTLSLLLGVDPEAALTASSVNDLTVGLPEVSLSGERQDAFQSLFNQIQALNTINAG
jgi:hypothetical protein